MMLELDNQSLYTVIPLQDDSLQVSLYNNVESDSGWFTLDPLDMGLSGEISFTLSVVEQAHFVMLPFEAERIYLSVQNVQFFSNNGFSKLENRTGKQKIYGKPTQFYTPIALYKAVRRIRL